MTDHETRMSAAKVAVSWGLTLLGSVTLQQVSYLFAIVYTGLQIYVTLRDKFGKRRE